MVNDAILGGLRSALIRNYSLKDAMMSFYNAGYKKEDIEEAARVLQYEMRESGYSANEGAWNQEKSRMIGPPKVIQVPPQANLQKKPEAPKPASNPQEAPKSEAPKPEETKTQEKPKKLPTEEHEKAVSKPEQKSDVSSYGKQGHKPKIKPVTIALIAILLFLFGILGAIFFFRDSIIQFFNSFF